MRNIKISGAADRPFTIFFKIVRTLKYFLARVKLSLEIQRMGGGCKVLPGVTISGGKNICLGEKCYIGRNVLLDASQGTINIGNDVEIRDNVRIYAQNISLGDNVTLGEGAFLNGDIIIASGAWVARGCDLSGSVVIDKAILGPSVHCIGGNNHARDPKTGAILMGAGGRKDHRSHEKKKMIRILDGAWIGQNAILLKDVTISKNAVVGAGSVVTKGVPEGVVVAGNPAKPIQSLLSL